QKVASLTELLAQETKRREGAEHQAGEVGKRRTELEAELAQNKQAQARLRQQLEEIQKQAQALKSNHLAGQSKLEARTQELQAAQMPVEEKIRSLTEALAFETKRREAVERMAVDAFKRRRELEAKLAKMQEAEKSLQGQIEAPDGAKRRAELETELADNKRLQTKLRQELEEAQKQL